MLLAHELKLDIKGEAAVALGTFDGLHLGHQAVLREVTSSGFLPVALTFSGHPRKYLRDEQPPLLLTQEDKSVFLELLGIEAEILLDFASVRDLSPRAFLDAVTAALPVRLFSCGFNYRFGKNGEGDASFLRAYGAEKGIDVRVAPAVALDGQPVSSTLVRELLQNGDMEGAAARLGRPFSFCLEVVGGDQRGRTIGFPTINQALPDGLVQPRFGVYVSRTEVDGVWYPSVTNVGIRPTYLADRALSETHIVGYAGDLYGRRLRVELLHFLRGEEKFDSLEALKNAISRDLHASLYFERKNNLSEMENRP